MSVKYSAIIDFHCIEDGCDNLIKFNLMELMQNKGQLVCDHCHRHYQFDAPFIEKLEKLKKLVIAIKESEDILGDCNVAVMSEHGEVKIPYRLLMTRMNSMISLELSGKRTDFAFRIEPIEGSFR